MTLPSYLGALSQVYLPSFDLVSGTAPLSFSPMMGLVSPTDGWSGLSPSYQAWVTSSVTFEGSNLTSFNRRS